jgi:hypothetical protein
MVKVLFDHNMPAAIARALHEIIKTEGHASYSVRDRFSPDIGDIELFSALGADRDWVFLSKDTKNARRPAERAAIVAAGVLAFYLQPSVQRLRLAEQAATIFWHWDKIVQQRRINESGLFLLPINKSSRFRQL